MIDITCLMLSADFVLIGVAKNIILFSQINIIYSTIITNGKLKV